jgi:hypothetical protein
LTGDLLKILNYPFIKTGLVPALFFKHGRLKLSTSADFTHRHQGVPIDTSHGEEKYEFYTWADPYWLDNQKQHQLIQDIRDALEQAMGEAPAKR